MLWKILSIFIRRSIDSDVVSCASLEIKLFGTWIGWVILYLFPEWISIYRVVNLKEPHCQNNSCRLYRIFVFVTFKDCKVLFFPIFSLMLINLSHDTFFSCQIFNLDSIFSESIFKDISGLYLLNSVTKCFRDLVYRCFDPIIQKASISAYP